MSRASAALVLTAVLASAPAASAQDAEPVRETEEGMMLDFQDADLRTVVGALADLAGMNVVLSDLPSRSVTLRTNQAVTPDQVRGYLLSLAETYGLDIQEKNGLLHVTGEEGEEGGPEETRPRRAGGEARPAAGAGRPRLYVYRLRHAKAERMAATISAIFGAGGGPGGGPPARPQGLSRELERQRSVPYLERDDPAEGEGGDGGGAPPPGDVPGTPEDRRLPAQLKGKIRVVPEQFTNSLLIRATPADYRTIRAAVKELDTRPLQVLIEVLIAEVRRDRRVGFGLDLDVPADDDVSGTEVGGSVTGLSAGDVALQVLNVGGVDANAVLRMLSNSSDISILSRPVVLAQNNQEARILVGSQRPFVQLFRSLPTDAASRDQVVQFRDVGTELTIRPTINPDGYVSLDVLQEVSSATAEVQFGAPVISTREASTSLLVKDGHTVVLGGLVDRQRQLRKSGVPLLKDIPVLGGLFGSTNRRRITTELFVFLTPHVMRTDADMDEAAREMRESTEHLDQQIEDDGRIPLLHTDTVAAPADTSSAPPAEGPASPGSG